MLCIINDIIIGYARMQHPMAIEAVDNFAKYELLSTDLEALFSSLV